jgi:hypothetical protein
MARLLRAAMRAELSQVGEVAHGADWYNGAVVVV